MRGVPRIFPIAKQQRNCSNAVVGDVGFTVCNYVLAVLSRTELDSTSKELLCGYRRDACFLVVAGLPRDALADDKVSDVHFAIR